MKMRDLKIIKNMTEKLKAKIEQAICSKADECKGCPYAECILIDAITVANHTTLLSLAKTE